MNEDDRLYYTMRQVKDSVDEAIREAMERGDFDNLEGKGKPLAGLEENPYEDPTKRMAHKLMRDNNLLPPWMQLRQTIQKDFEDARRRLEIAWNWYEPAMHIPTPQDEAKWETAKASFHNKIKGLNKQIRTYNLKAPNMQVQLPLFHAEQEIRMITQSKREAHS